jgi:hypothetical protein
MKPEVLLSEARARIVWGESPATVRDYLITNGMSDLDADAKVKEFKAERNAEIRRIGLRNTVIGGAIMGVAGLTFYPCYNYFDPLSYSAGARIIIAFSIGGLYGLWRLAKGLAYFIRPQSEEKSLTEISEWERPGRSMQLSSACVAVVPVA